MRLVVINSYQFLDHVMYQRILCVIFTEEWISPGFHLMFSFFFPAAIKSHSLWAESCGVPITMWINSWHQCHQCKGVGHSVSVFLEMSGGKEITFFSCVPGENLSCHFSLMHTFLKKNSFVFELVTQQYDVSLIWGTNFAYCPRWFRYDRDWFVCKQAALRSSCATLR